MCLADGLMIGPTAGCSLVGMSWLPCHAVRSDWLPSLPAVHLQCYINMLSGMPANTLSIYFINRQAEKGIEEVRLAGCLACGGHTRRLRMRVSCVGHAWDISIEL